MPSCPLCINSRPSPCPVLNPVQIIYLFLFPSFLLLHPFLFLPNFISRPCFYSCPYTVLNFFQYFCYSPFLCLYIHVNTVFMPLSLPSLFPYPYLPPVPASSHVPVHSLTMYTVYLPLSLVCPCPYCFYALSLLSLLPFPSFSPTLPLHMSLSTPSPRSLPLCLSLSCLAMYRPTFVLTVSKLPALPSLFPFPSFITHPCVYSCP